LTVLVIVILVSTMMQLDRMHLSVSQASSEELQLGSHMCYEACCGLQLASQELQVCAQHHDAVAVRKNWEYHH